MLRGDNYDNYYDSVDNHTDLINQCVNNDHNTTNTSVSSAIISDETIVFGLDKDVN